jgi:putative copper export protein
LTLVAALLVIVGAAARLVLQILELRDPDLALGPQVRALLLHTSWGRDWFAQVALAAALAIGGAAAGRGGRLGWPLATASAILLAWTPAFAGHAIGSERWTGMTVIADGLHVVGGGAWLGAMAVLAAALVLARDRGQQPIAAAMVAAYSPLALAGAGLVAASGLVSTLVHLSGPLSDLWRTAWGRTLLVKLALVALMLALGAWNWRRAGPALRGSGAVGPMLRSVRAELAVGGLIVLATAVLIATAPPGE